MATNVRKIFSVLIDETIYDVYDIYGKEHEGYNDTPKTWWLYYSDRLIDGELPLESSSNWKPYSRSIIRRCWEVKIKQKNSSREKWGDVQFRNSAKVDMWCDNKLVYSFMTGGNDLSFAVAKFQYLQIILSEHPYNFFEPETEVGRKIGWYGLPATILTGYDVGNIRIKPDYTAGLDKKEWWAELKRRQHVYTDRSDDFYDDDKDDENDDYENDDIINWGDALSDGNIYWFRK